jgi:endo-1,4-beta-mannosidase
MARFLLGINYWPRRSAMGMWDAFDVGELDDDFARIAALGLDVVRFFLIWEVFQPAPRTVDREALRKLETLIERLAEHRLRAMPTFFTGHMSGVNWLPEWTLDHERENGLYRTFNAHGERTYGIGDFYADPDLFEAQRLQVRTVGERFREHPAIMAWDLGNEFSNLRTPDDLHEATEWAKRLTHELHTTSRLPVTAGTHGEDLSEDNRLRLSSLCSDFDFATMHGYTVYSAFARDRLDREVVPFLAALTGAFAKRPVLFSEFGNPTCPNGTVAPYDREPLLGEWVAPARPPGAENLAPFACLTETEMSAYAYRVLDRLQRRGAIGAFWWCYADYADELAGRPPFDRAKHELSFGIVRSDGTLRPIAATLEQFAREAREVVAAPEFVVDEAQHYELLPDSITAEYATYLSSEVIRSA